MAVTVVAAGTGDYTSTTQVSITLSASPAENDVIVAFIGSTTNAALSASSFDDEWLNALGGTTIIVSADTAVAASCIYHVVTAAEDTANQTTWLVADLWNSAETGEWAAVALRGANTTTPIAAATTAQSGGADNPQILPAVPSGSVPSTGDLVVRAVVKDAAGSYTTPTGHTQQAASGTAQGIWLGTRDAATTAATEVAATDITVDVGDEYGSVSLIIAATGGGSDATPTPAAIATAGALPAPTVTAGGTATPATAATTTNLPAPTILTGASATPSTIATAVSVGTATVTTGATVTATTVSTAAALPAPSVLTGSNATVTPAVIAATSALPAPTVQTGSHATPATIATVSAVGAATVQAGTAVTAVAIATVTALPAPLVSSGTNATITATAITTTVTMAAVSMTTGSTATPATVTTTSAVPAPTVTTLTTVSVTTITTTITMPTPTLRMGATIGAQVIATLTQVGVAFLALTGQITHPVARGGTTPRGATARAGTTTRGPVAKAGSSG